MSGPTLDEERQWCSQVDEKAELDEAELDEVPENRSAGPEEAVMGWSQALFGRSGQRGRTADVPPDVVPELDSGAWVSTWGWTEDERTPERQDGPSRWVVGRGTSTLVTDSSQWAGGGM